MAYQPPAETLDEPMAGRIADDNGWWFGETLEQVVVLLQRECGGKN